MSTATTLIPTIPAGTAIVLTDDLLGLPLLERSLGGPITLRGAVVDTTVAGVITVHGVADVLGAADVMVDITVAGTDTGAPEAELRLTVATGSPWGPAGLALTAVTIQLRMYGDPGDRHVEGTLTGTTMHGPITFTVSVPSADASVWTLATEVDGALIAVLTDVAGDSLASLTDGDAPVVDLGTVVRVALGVSVDMAGPSIAAITAELETASWSPTPLLEVRDVVAHVGVEHPLDRVIRTVEVDVHGTLRLGTVELAISAQRRPGDDAAAPWVFRGGLGAAPAPTLSSVLEGFGGSAVMLPSEVPDVSLTRLDIAATPQHGAFTVDAACEAGWTLPFGGAGPTVGRVGLRVERPPTTADEAATTAIAIDVEGSGRMPIADGFDVTGLELTFHREGAEHTWTVGGTMAAEILAVPTTFSASLTDGPDGRVFSFEEAVAEGQEGRLAVDLGGAGSLGVDRLLVRVTRPRTGGAPTGGARLDTSSVYAWTVEAAGHLDLVEGAVVVDGIIVLEGAPGLLHLSLRPGAGDRAAEVDVALPGTDSVRLHLGVERIDVARRADPGAATWTVQADVTTWFSGLPDAVADLLPSSSESELRGRLEVMSGPDAHVAVAIDPVLPVQSFRLPAVDVAGSHVDLGATPSAVSVGRLDLRWSRGGQINVDVDFGIGLPVSLDDELAGGHDVLVTYDEATRTGLLHARLTASTAGGTPSLSVTPLDSPFTDLAFDPVAPDAPIDAPRHATFDLGEYGSLALQVPTVAVSADTMRVSGGFTQRDLALPLSPVAWVLQALELPKLAALLPSKLPLRDLPILTAARELDVELLLETIVSDVADMPNIELPAGTELRDALQTFADRLDQLPERLMPYLDIHVPEHLAFDVAGSVAGAVRGRVSVATADGAVGRDVATPLRLLFPGLSATGPVLNGIELWSLSIGEILGGAALVVTADLNVDQFDILPLAAMLAAPDALESALPPTTDLTRRLVAERVTLLIVPEAFVVVPVFFEDLGVEYRGSEGIDLGAHLSFPQPSVDLAGAFALFGRLKSFFTSRDAMLDEHDIASSGLDLELTAGPAFLQLPDYLGGQLLGSRTATSSVSAGAGLTHLLNGLKRLHIDELLAAVPEAMRQGPPAATPHVEIGPVDIDGIWSASTPPGSPRGLAVHVGGSAMVGPATGLRAAVDVRTAGTSAFGLGFSVDGAIGDLVGMHLDGALDTGALTRGAGGGVLTFTEPSARVRTSGPIWAPPQFTVEFWLRPTALSNYNQTVSADDRWGAFVFHTTDGGAVYCGTDGVTRFTPADLPAGTVRAGVWQHIAVSFDHGTAVVHRDGVPIATKHGLRLPEPWTGMRLGTSAPGSQIQGDLAELRVWDHARSASEIVASMHGRAGGNEPGLVACWPLDEGTGPVVHDRSPQHFDGAATLTTWSAADGTALPIGGPPAAPSVRISGTSSLSLGGRTVFHGHVSVQPDRATLDGDLDVFGDSTLLSVRGHVAGAIDREHFRLDGQADVALEGLHLAAMTAALTDQRLALHGAWLGVLDTDLVIDGAGGRLIVNGSISGGFPIDVTLPALTVPTPERPVKLTDSVHLSTTVQVAFNVRAETATGLWLDGNVGVLVDGRWRTFHLRLSTVPADFAALQRIVTDYVQGMTRDIVTSLYPTARDWVNGVASGAIGWTRTAWDDTAVVLKTWFQQSPGAVARMLDDASFSPGEIGHVLKAEFVRDWNDMVQAFKSANLSIGKVADAVFTVFEQPFGRDLVTQARSVTSMLRNWYDANSIASMLRRNFNLGTTWTLQILAEQRYITREIATAAKEVCHLLASETAAAFQTIGIAGDDALRSLAATYTDTSPAVIASSLAAAGYARSTLNSVLAGWNLPPL